MLGEGIFETIRIERKQPRYSFLHWQRMRQAAEFLNIPFELSQNEWKKELQACITDANLEQGGVKVILTSGGAERGLSAKALDSNLWFNAFTLPQQSNAITLISAPWVRDSKNPIYHYKSINYLEAIQAQRLAKTSGAEDVLFFNTEGFATETTVANIFAIHNDVLYTPSLNCGLLAGIIRARLIQIATICNIKYVEGLLSRSLLQNAEALFVTNALVLLMPIQRFDGQSFNIRNPMMLELQALISADSEHF
ncbi:aminotransferase class IV [Legionella yabuuchiae]|uniref:aminotransferase class IV n=1 Tax=Legionella yabuuchiae TaxID=376727 RepID=UPI001F5EAE1D|nr:aminotransferase class IV [Legionella yabuuchiae]